MNWKRTMLLTLIIAVIGTTAVFAKDIVETIRAKKITVQTGGTSITGYSVQSNGKVLVPLDEITETLEAVVEYNDDEVEIYKPNVHLSLFNVARKTTKLFGFTIKKDEYTLNAPFGVVTEGGEYEFIISAQVDSMPVEVENIQYEIIDPDGEQIYSSSYQIKLKDYFWHTTEPISLRFNQTGEYKINLYMQTEPKGDYHLVSRKILKTLPK